MAGKLAQARNHDAKAPARAAARNTQPLSSAGFELDRYQSGIDHFLIDLRSGMVNWYKEIPLFDFLSGPCELGGIEHKTSNFVDILSTFCRAFLC